MTFKSVMKKNRSVSSARAVTLNVVVMSSFLTECTEMKATAFAARLNARVPRLKTHIVTKVSWELVEAKPLNVLSPPQLSLPDLTC